MSDKIPVDELLLFKMITIIVESAGVLERVQALKLDGVIACDIDDVLFSIDQYKKELDVGE